MSSRFSVFSSFITVQAATGLAALIVNVALARSLGPEGRGEIALYLQIAVIVGTLGMGGVERSYPALAIDNQTLLGSIRETRRLAIPGISLILIAALTLTALSNVVLGVSPLVPVAVGIIASGSAFGSLLRAAASAAGNSQQFLRAAMLSQALLLTSAAFLYLFGIRQSEAWLLAYGISLLFPYLTFPRSREAFGFRDKSKQGDSQAIRKFGLKILPSTLANMVAMRADRLLLPVLSGFEQLGLYGTVATMTELVSLPVNAYVDSTIPSWRRRFLEGSLKPWKIISATAAYGTISALVAASAISASLGSLFGTSYKSAAELCLPLTAAAALLGIARVAAGLAAAAGRSRAIATIDIPAMTVSVASYVLLIPNFGALGAAYGSLIGYGSSAAVALAIVIRGKGARA